MTDTQKQAVKNYFDQTAQEYSLACSQKDSDAVRNYIFSTRKAFVLEMVCPGSGRALDVGCGPAVFTEELIQKGYAVTGIDVSEEMLARAREKMRQKNLLTQCHFVLGDIENLDFPDDSFDLILCVGVLEYLNNDSQALKEIKRVLKKTGRAIITVPNLASPLTMIDKSALKLISLFTKVPAEGRRLCFRKDITDRYYLPWELKRNLVNVGLNVLRNKCHAFRLSLINSLFPRLGLILIKKSEVLSHTFLKGWGINYIVEVSKEEE